LTQGIPGFYTWIGCCTRLLAPCKLAPVWLQCFNAAPQLVNARAQCLNAAPQLLNAGSQLLNARAQCLNAAAQLLSAAPQLFNAAPQHLRLRRDNASATAQLSKLPTQHARLDRYTFIQASSKLGLSGHNLSNWDRDPGSAPGNLDNRGDDWTLPPQPSSLLPALNLFVTPNPLLSRLNSPQVGKLTEFSKLYTLRVTT
jgi:hypothetical protein